MAPPDAVSKWKTLLSKPGYECKSGISIDVNWNTGKAAVGIEGA